MTYLRTDLVDEVNGGVYHCISRCVRRAWLCGEDPLTGRSFEHRRQWVEDRMVGLSRIFAVDLYGYAVMSNHYHLVIRTRPRVAREWSDAEVADRWLQLLSLKTDKARAQTKAALLQDAARLDELRSRLGSLSCFMAKLNEPIARRANIEDDCTGRFWEGRFKSIPLLDDTAVIATMTYVDLNPYRAAMVRSPERAKHTSIAKRLNEQHAESMPLAPLEDLGLDLDRYVDLLYWTAGIERQRDDIELLTHAAVGTDRIAWVRLVESNAQHWRAYGSIEKIREFARAIGQRWIKGYRLRPQPT